VAVVDTSAAQSAAARGGELVRRDPEQLRVPPEPFRGASGPHTAAARSGPGVHPERSVHPERAVLPERSLHTDRSVQTERAVHPARTGAASARSPERSASAADSSAANPPPATSPRFTIEPGRASDAAAQVPAPHLLADPTSTATAEQRHAQPEPPRAPATESSIPAAPTARSVAEHTSAAPADQPQAVGEGSGALRGEASNATARAPAAAAVTEQASDTATGRSRAQPGRSYLDVPAQSARQAPLTAAEAHREPGKPASAIKPLVQLVRVHGALTSRRALRGIARVEPLLAACWHAAPESSAWKLTSNIDPHGRARTTTVAAISGAGHAATLESCIERAAHQLQVDAPDTGGAVIEWSVTAIHPE